MEEKRKINSVAELVNAWGKGYPVGEKTPVSEILYLDCVNLDDNLQRLKVWVNDGVFYYNMPVEVVELWGSSLIVWFKDKQEQHTHKQTQIHQNNKIIWTETIKIK